MRIGPLRPRLGAAGFRLTLPLIEHYYRRRSIFRSISRFALKRFAALRAKLDRGETVYLAGIGAGTHNSGVALVEVTRHFCLALVFPIEAALTTRRGGRCGFGGMMARWRLHSS
jgi:hypothetical protein